MPVGTRVDPVMHLTFTDMNFSRNTGANDALTCFCIAQPLQAVIDAMARGASVWECVQAIENTPSVA